MAGQGMAGYGRAQSTGHRVGNHIMDVNEWANVTIIFNR